MNHSEQAAGAAVGGTLGFAKSLLMISHLSWGAVLDTAILAGVGAVVGFAVTSLLKWLKKKFTK